MAKFANLTFTSQGTQMLVQAQNSHTLTFTCGKLGSGVLADSDNISKFTDLKSPKMTLPIVSVDDSNEEKIVLTFDTSNTELEEGFVSREIGIFAKLDNGFETLYAYSNAGNNYDYIPGKDTPSDENRLVVNLVVSSSANISVQIDKSIVYTHKSEVEEMIATHDASDTAHEPAFTAKFKAHNADTDAHKDFVGATAEKAGVRGMLPAAPAGAQDKVFNGGGKWVYAALNILQRNKAYQVGDYAYSPTLPSWAYLECVTAGTTAATEPSLPSTINSVVTDGTASFKLYHVALQSQPVGTVRDFTVEFDPNTKWGGTWSKMDAGRVLVSAGTYTEGSDTYTYTLGDKGGEAKHQLTTDELPSHTHVASISSGGEHIHYISRNIDITDVHVGEYGPSNDTVSNYDGAQPFKTSSAGNHTHTVTVNNTGGNTSFNEMQPYDVVFRWKRTA